MFEFNSVHSITQLPVGNIRLLKPQDYQYLNRKKLLDPRGECINAINLQLEHSNFKRIVRIFDTNFQPEHAKIKNAPILNLITPKNSPKANSFDWIYIQGAVPDNEISACYAEIVLHSSSSCILHIDHHYPIDSIALTSTTPLVFGLVKWAHQNKQEEFLHRIASGFAFFDHCDADILLSQYIATRALDKEFLEVNGALLCATALLNDHLILPTDRVLSEKTKIFYRIILDLEQKIIDQVIDVSVAFELINDALEFGNRVVDLYQLNDTTLTSAHEQNSLAAELTNSPLLESYLLGKVRSAPEDNLVAALPHVTIETGINCLQEDAITRIGKIVVLNTSEHTFDFAGSNVVLALLSQDLEFMHGVKVVVTCYPMGHGFCMKFRSVVSAEAGFCDLNQVYAEIRKRFPDSYGQYVNGRATAGGLKNGAISGDKNLALRDIIPLVQSHI